MINESVSYQKYAFHTIFNSTDRWVCLITVRTQEEGMVEAVTVWFLLIVGSASVGGLCALALKKKPALILSALIPWIIFLAFNLYSEFYSPDHEIMQGSWWFFQATFGSIALIIGLLSALSVLKLRGCVLTLRSSGTAQKRAAP